MQPKGSCLCSAMYVYVLSKHSLFYVCLTHSSSLRAHASDWMLIVHHYVEKC